MNHRHSAAAAITLLALGLAGCAGGSGSGSGSTGTGTDPSPSSAAQTSGSPSTTPAASESSGPSAGGTTVIAAGGCSLIDQAKAEELMGTKLKKGIDSGGSGEIEKGFTKLDGCFYDGSDRALGYTVIAVKNDLAPKMLKAAEAKLRVETKRPGSPAKEFDTGLADSFGFVLTLPKGFDSQITTVAGEWFITVAATDKTGDKAASQTAAVAAMQVLTASA